MERDDDEILDLLNSDYVQTPGLEVGGGGKRILRFKAKKSGDVLLVLKLWRAWEGDKYTVDHFEIMIHVKANI